MVTFRRDLKKLHHFYLKWPLRPFYADFTFEFHEMEFILKNSFQSTLARLHEPFLGSSKIKQGVE